MLHICHDCNKIVICRIAGRFDLSKQDFYVSFRQCLNSYRMGKRKFMLLLLLGCAVTVSGQSFLRPNHGLKSPETLEVSRVELTAAGTVIYLTVENRVPGGNFCADRNISLTDQDGNVLTLKKARGIPVCPETYTFKGIGEKLSFSLEFPALKENTKWIDLVEECSSNCFRIYGITLDNELNRRLDEAFAAAAGNSPVQNIELFRGILEPIDEQDLGIEGLLYLNIINAASENADRAGVSAWYRKLSASNAPRLKEYLKYLNDRGIK